MKTTHDFILDLLDHRSSLRPRDIQRHCGTSRQTVWSQLRKLEEAGVVVREGVGRGCRYRRASHAASAPCPEDPSAELWMTLTSRCPFVRVVTLRQAIGTRCRTRREALHLLEQIPADSLLVLDCSGVTHMSDAFAHALFYLRGPAPTVGTINMPPGVAETVARVRARYWRLPHSDYGT